VTILKGMAAEKDTNVFESTKSSRVTSIIGNKSDFSEHSGEKLWESK